MLLNVILSLLFGMVLGQRYSVLILAPVILLALVIAIGGGLARTAPLSVTILMAAAGISCLQVGYVFGLGIRHLTAATRSSRMHENSRANSLQRRRTAY